MKTVSKVSQLNISEKEHIYEEGNCMKILKC